MKLLRVVLLALTGCASYPTPDPNLVVHSAMPWVDADKLAESINGAALRELPTGSMEPLITGGDYAVVDFGFPWASIQPGMVLAYDPNWMDESVPLVSHMAVARTGDGWIMTGIANQYSESGAHAMMQADYRGRIVKVFTSR